ncbi:3-deoxy-8-phosphooctulonate synthase [Desulfatirhabdium butyrativorans]|uniref:3-deoxy-8-phosphooctulonate synthase n=1 Tax=Desulfatirhabdium butyrativorans TaxID=340467 RepID=UPI000415E6B7|nr:3-deoxy-8-phosphooctulonate synthase [Desulfatirhabdium butyrativorans]
MPIFPEKSWTPEGWTGGFFLIAGPCVIEDAETTKAIASYLKELTARLGISLVFKASYDKANRTSAFSYRGPGLEKGLAILDAIRRDVGVPVLSDVHSVAEMAPAAQVLDILQIPAFLCRQTDILQAAGRTGKPINVKKGQFLAPWDMRHVIEKIRQVGNHRIFLTERGTLFGYNSLVVDFRSMVWMKQFACPVVFDATHSVQIPGGQGDRSGGERALAPHLARAAVAAGADGIFMEVHPDPDKALCDGPNSLALRDLPELLKQLKTIYDILHVHAP